MFLRTSFQSKKTMPWLGALLGLAITVGLLVYFLGLRFQASMFPPNTIINQINVGGLSTKAALSKLNQDRPAPTKVELANNNQIVLVDGYRLGLSYHYEHIVKQDVEAFQALPPLERGFIILLRMIRPKIIEANLTVDQDKTVAFLDEFEANLKNPTKLGWVELTRVGDQKVPIVHQTQPGQLIDKNMSLASFNPTKTPPQLAIHYALPPSKLTKEQINLAKQRARRFIDRSIMLTNSTHQLRFVLSDKDLIEFIDPYGGWKKDRIKQKIKQLANQANRPPVNARFDYNPKTLRVDFFQPDQPGISIDGSTLSHRLVQKLNQLESVQSKNQLAQEDKAEVEIPIIVIEPEVKLKDTNDLGINQLIGQGESYYYHSIPSRIHNISLASQKINQIIIKPKEEFSFNQAIGEVSKRTGYQSAYIIKNGRTEKGDGGGVCQVSTTLFRAILDAGLKITKRVPHSYRVSYYELNNKPGVDATVFGGDVDLRFINDTPAYILVRSVNDRRKLHLRYEVYGTSDGRQTEIVNHKVWGLSPPPPPEYIVDPSLPPNTKKQVDWAVSGAQTTFTNLIKKDGRVIREDVYTSNYKPWSSKYLVSPDQLSQ